MLAWEEWDQAVEEEAAAVVMAEVVGVADASLYICISSSVFCCANMALLPLNINFLR